MLIVVLTMMLLFVAAGGAALLMTGILGGYQKNRELSTQAMYAAEAGLHKATYQLMASSGLATINTTSIAAQTFASGYEPTLAAIFETTVTPGAAWEGRIYTRGSAGNGRVVKFMRAYVRVQSVGYGGTLYLYDWQEIPRSVVVAHRDSLDDANPKKAEFTNWL